MGCSQEELSWCLWLFSPVYERMKKSFQSRQGGCPLVEYYNELNSIFMELHYRRPNDMTCVANIGKQRKCTIEDRIYIFLTNLDHGWNQVSGRVFSHLSFTKSKGNLFTRSLWSAETSHYGNKRSLWGIHYGCHKNNTQPTPFTPIDSSSCFCTHCNNTKYTVDVC